MDRAKQYRINAEEAERRAELSTRAGERQSHLLMARTWRQMEHDAGAPGTEL